MLRVESMCRGTERVPAPKLWVTAKTKSCLDTTAPVLPHLTSGKNCVDLIGIEDRYVDVKSGCVCESVNLITQTIDTQEHPIMSEERVCPNLASYNMCTGSRGQILRSLATSTSPYLHHRVQNSPIRT
ncbi:hypothetical protein F2P81_012294 [Scophthalmus maximus]|uniref:Uncharacterized protein n=1 Tax=Scophthalmus maximus TaxID=52904 RepID=A0A6A4SHA3_SCOMX|nr:hypothetical protein F2P81_012294 [Scophthalmus maximus]